ncbi:hypothetical protein OIU77_024278 [Salix suchowensis]|uniref:Uncharacterized protein n=1 Tax=Salix suchowensis TaxID=1278906 RepID=A0ABQ9BTU7_9ROSI|nr:hypothetical protein OIU77_024278 [Salix suchowensis]KAJ6390018.1 hypothetical protein OIU77_024278 [Salix suchowensis]KAJ6390019.1 hypothetical protein OIU77_024278 [Salix suchowensis]KAJ6390020.1 hypothetical protein OIU77_024278 [Salix suchowensis]
MRKSLLQKKLGKKNSMQHKVLLANSARKNLERLFYYGPRIFSSHIPIICLLCLLIQALRYFYHKQFLSLWSCTFLYRYI